MTSGRAGAHLDESLLLGFRYRCRAGCGLCCFATPAASRAEVVRLRSVAPRVACFPAADGFSLLAARPQGGACQFLSDASCKVHAARPFPCREFPLTVHVGDRVQVALVLSCPGIDLHGLSRWSNGGAGPPEGFELETEAVREETGRRPVERWLTEAGRRRRTLERRLARDGRGGSGWADVEPRLVRRAPVPPAACFPVALPPAEESPLESLPLFHDAEEGTVALRAHAGGMELLVLAEGGGPPRSLGVLVPPDRPPALGEEGRNRLGDYLRYVVARDSFLWGLLADVASGDAPNPTLEEHACAARDEIAAHVLTRAWVRARFTGRTDGPLGAPEIDEGIRAYDAELLDRPTLGRVL